MAISSTSFAPGQVSNPNGRTPGSRNRRTKEIFDLLQARGDKDPLDFLSSIVSGNGEYPVELKVTAANYLLPFKHSKCGSTPPLRYIEEPVELPHPEPTSIEQANTNINYISARKAAGTLDLDFADSLITDNRVIANNIIAEEELRLKLAAAPGAIRDQTIRIEGGFPALPGTNVIMPHINGASGQGQELQNGHTLDLEKTAETTTLPAPAADDQTSQDPQP